MTTRPWLRFFMFFLPLMLVAVTGLRSADAGGSAHPYFNDRGTLRWYHSFEEAKRVAQREQKMIFIEYGRRACSNCRKIAQNVLPHSAVRPRLSRLAIGLAADCDRPESAVYHLFQRNLRNANMLPFCAFVTPRGRWVTGWGGYASVGQMQQHLAMAEARHRAIFASTPHAPQARPSTRPVGASQARSAGSPTQPSTPTPVVVPTPEPIPSADLGYTDADLGADEPDPCPGGVCEGGSCTPPGGGCAPPSGFGQRVIAGVKNLFGNGGSCMDCTPRTPTDCAPPTAAGPYSAGAPTRIAQKPVPRIQTPPSPAAPEQAACTSFPTAAPRIQDARVASRDRTWPRRATGASDVPVPSAMPYGDPDAEALPKPVVRTADQLLAETAAKRGDWAQVIRLTRGAGSEQAALRSLNRQAHAWAHSRLAFAVRAVRDERYDEARRAMSDVNASMKGEPESVDAERGFDAIVLMQDMTGLPEDSPLRPTVRKTAYEQMRGTRWAPLFSEVPMPSRAISKR